MALGRRSLSVDGLTLTEGESMCLPPGTLPVCADASQRSWPMLEGSELPGPGRDSSAASREHGPDLPPHRSGEEQWLGEAPVESQCCQGGPEPLTGPATGDLASPLQVEGQGRSRPGAGRRPSPLHSSRPSRPSSPGTGPGPGRQCERHSSQGRGARASAPHQECGGPFHLSSGATPAPSHQVPGSCGASRPHL